MANVSLIDNTIPFQRAMHATSSPEKNLSSRHYLATLAESGSRSNAPNRILRHLSRPRRTVLCLAKEWCEMDGSIITDELRALVGKWQGEPYIGGEIHLEDIRSFHWLGKRETMWSVPDYSIFFPGFFQNLFR
jgi:hypothetical protein